MHVYFPGVVLSVDMSTNCHLSYAPLGNSAPLSILLLPPTQASVGHFGPAVGLSPLPACPFWATLPLSRTILPSLAQRREAGPSAPPAQPSNVTPTFTSPLPKWAPPVPPTSFSADDIASIAQHLQVLSNKLSRLQSLPPSSPET